MNKYTITLFRPLSKSDILFNEKVANLNKKLIIEPDTLEVFCWGKTIEEAKFNLLYGKCPMSEHGYEFKSYVCGHTNESSTYLWINSSLFYIIILVVLAIMAIFMH